MQRLGYRFGITSVLARVLRVLWSFFLRKRLILSERSYGGAFHGLSRRGLPAAADEQQQSHRCRQCRDYLTVVRDDKILSGCAAYST